MRYICNLYNYAFLCLIFLVSRIEALIFSSHITCKETYRKYLFFLLPFYVFFNTETSTLLFVCYIAQKLPTQSWYWYGAIKVKSLSIIIILRTSGSINIPRWEGVCWEEVWGTISYVDFICRLRHPKLDLQLSLLSCKKILAE